MFGSDDEDHKNLCGKRLDEPTGMEERFVDVEDPQQKAENDEIEHRTERSKHEHEFADDGEIPSTRAGHRCIIDTIKRNCRLRQIVEQVVEQDLDGQHRQERQEQNAACH